VAQLGRVFSKEQHRARFSDGDDVPYIEMAGHSYATCDIHAGAGSGHSFRLREIRGSSRLCSLAVRPRREDQQKLMGRYQGVKEEEGCDCDRRNAADEDR
jgi:hypothetical protein